MGMCLPCLGGAADDVVVTPDPEIRRRQLAEAAEKRQKETAYRGVKNPEAVERKRKKQEDIEKQTVTSSVSGGGGLKVSVVFTFILSYSFSKKSRLLCFRDLRSVTNVIPGAQCKVISENSPCQFV
uniref:Small VCP interacting protein n=1 Tax=Mastacembelus armatus TaxID=205130 RepID=A0A3Q3RM67_9TELE